MLNAQFFSMARLRTSSQQVFSGASKQTESTMNESEFEISLVRDDPLFRLQRRLRLIPAEGLGLVRRAVLFALLTWLPIAVWAVVRGRGRGWQGLTTSRHGRQLQNKTQSTPYQDATTAYRAVPTRQNRRERF